MINLNESTESIVNSLLSEIVALESSTKVVLSQDNYPNQKDWETFWLSSGNVLPIPEGVELIWERGGKVEAVFSTKSLSHYPIMSSLPDAPRPDNYLTKDSFSSAFLGWEDPEHFFVEAFINSDILYGAGVTGSLLEGPIRYGLYRVYLDGYHEYVDLGVSPRKIIAYDELSENVWLEEMTLGLGFVNLGTLVFTSVSASPSVKPQEIRFDSIGDAFLAMDIGAGFGLYHWDASLSTLTQVKTTVLIDGVASTDYRVAEVTDNYVIVIASAFFIGSFDSLYYIQIERANYANEFPIKASPVGATPPTLPTIPAQALIIVSNEADVLGFVYSGVLAPIDESEWKKVFLWDLTTQSYTESAGLPYNNLLDTYKNNFSLIGQGTTQKYFVDPIVYYSTALMRYNNLTARTQWQRFVYSKITDKLLLRSTRDTNVPRSHYLVSTNSEGKVWRVSAWDNGVGDSLVLGLVEINSLSGLLGKVDITDRPKGYNIIEVTLHSAVTNGAEAVLTGEWLADGGTKNITNNLISGGGQEQGAGGVDVDNNTYAGGNTTVRIQGSNVQNPLSLAQAFFILPEGDSGLGASVVFARETTATGVVNQTVTYTVHVHILGSNFFPMQTLEFRLGAGTALSKGQYFMVRALRTEGRRQGDNYFDYAMD